MGKDFFYTVYTVCDDEVTSSISGLRNSYSGPIGVVSYKELKLHVLELVVGDCIREAKLLMEVLEEMDDTDSVDIKYM